MAKKKFKGKISGVQPRIRLLRSFDQSSHSYLGYNIFLEGTIEGDHRKFIIAIGKSTQAKFKFQPGQHIQGVCTSVINPLNEIAEYFKVSQLSIIDSTALKIEPPPYLELPKDLEIYRERGHRRLAAKSYNTTCQYCHWACKMPTVILIDQWDQSKKKYRVETFCYGPKSCRYYVAGPVRKVPGRRGMVWEEEDWVDEENTSHRGPDE